MVAITLALSSMGLLGCAGRSIGRDDSPLLNQAMMGWRVTTAGQPTREQLTRLREHGIRLVVHLATPSSTRAVADERDIVRRQGLSYIRFDLDPEDLAASDLARVFKILSQSHDTDVLVHCELNVLAATFVFLYRVIERGENLQGAMNELEMVTVPRGALRRFANSQLARIGARLDGAD